MRFIVGWTWKFKIIGILWHGYSWKFLNRFKISMRSFWAKIQEKMSKLDFWQLKWKLFIYDGNSRNLMVSRNLIASLWISSLFQIQVFESFCALPAWAERLQTGLRPKTAHFKAFCFTYLLVKTTPFWINFNIWLPFFSIILSKVFIVKWAGG